MKYKSDVSIKFLYPVMAELQNAIQLSSPEGYEPTITSANDGKHGVGSLHPDDKAYDIRVRDFPGFSLQEFEETKFIIYEWIERIKIYLKNPNDFDIVFGDENHRNHIHAEWDIK